MNAKKYYKREREREKEWKEMKREVYRERDARIKRKYTERIKETWNLVKRGEEMKERKQQNER